MSFPKHDVQGVLQQEVRFPCGFLAASAASPTVFYGAGARMFTSIAHTSTGIWTITIKAKFRLDVLAFSGLSIKRVSAADDNLQFGPYSKTNGTIVVRVHTGGSLADIGTDQIFFDLCMRYGSVAEGATYVST